MSSSEKHSLVRAVKRQLQDVMDPELPFLTIGEMGMLRDIYLKDGHTVIVLTPTYSGCPATDIISKDSLKAARVVDPNAEVEISLRPAWTTDWISEETRLKMTENGISPPIGESHDRAFLTGDGKVVPCPLCKSKNTKMVSAFGSTACKASFTCLDCMEPFEHFKCI
ncbi:MAG: phenylacetate-CoA oxygenase subunit PaaJ [Crocinitomicaceae bacterium]|nr:phenylacetate-CoA oxygenase subunit PaaJ [Crocinitomicaceae bacterium]|tara:strand:+ start:673 stop:1173 length:501 start_codon:yes stop_codon:yes gene_type:complete